MNRICSWQYVTRDDGEDTVNSTPLTRSVAHAGKGRARVRPAQTADVERVGLEGRDERLGLRLQLPRRFGGERADELREPALG